MLILGAVGLQIRLSGVNRLLDSALYSVGFAIRLSDCSMFNVVENDKF